MKFILETDLYSLPPIFKSGNLLLADLDAPSKQSQSKLTLQPSLPIDASTQHNTITATIGHQSLFLTTTPHQL